MYYDWNLKEAEKEFKLALNLNPNSAYTLTNFSLYLLFTGNHEQAIREGKRARELDPLSLFINLNYGDVYFYAGFLDKAMEVYTELLEINPHHAFAHYMIGHVFEAKSLISDAINEYKKADKLSNGDPLAISSLACCYYLLGKKEKAEFHFSRLRKRSAQEYVPPTVFYSYYLIRDDIDQAYEWFEKAITERDTFLNYMSVCPTLGHRIPDDPRFNKLLNKVGLSNLRRIDC